MLPNVPPHSLEIWTSSGWNKRHVLSCLRSRIVLSCVAFLSCISTLAGQTAIDSVMSERFRPVQLIVPGALIAVGSVGVSNGWFCSVKNDVRKEFYALRGDRRIRVDDYLQYFPLATHLGLGFIGVKPKHAFRERLAVAATASVALATMVNAVKYAVREKRPDSNTRNSFPSGHTATAFMGAELVRSEYGNAYGAGAYAVATGIAVLRVYNDRHWLNDVIGGVGFGILSARVGYWLLPCERKLFRWKSGDPSVSALPTYNPVGHSVGISVCRNF